MSITSSFGNHPNGKLIGCCLQNRIYHVHNVNKQFRRNNKENINSFNFVTVCKNSCAYFFRVQGHFRKQTNSIESFTSTSSGQNKKCIFAPGFLLLQFEEIVQIHLFTSSLECVMKSRWAGPISSSKTIILVSDYPPIVSNSHICSLVLCSFY